MNNTTGVILFVAGVGIGMSATAYYLKNKYEEITKLEIESVKQVFAKKEAAIRERADQAKDKPSINEYMDKVRESRYSVEEVIVEEKKEENMTDKPYVITPDEFGEYDDYERLSLTYYADGVLTDECDEVIYDADSVVGEGSLSTFGQYEEDCVFVRDDILRCDYEILLDSNCYELK